MDSSIEPPSLCDSVTLLVMEDSVKTYISALFVDVASTAYAASTTVTINAIDANGVGKKIGTIELSDTNEGLRMDRPQPEGFELLWHCGSAVQLSQI